MTPIEFEMYRNMQEEPTTIEAARFAFESGTILYGYTIEHEPFHVYKMNGEIHRHIYTPSNGLFVTLDHSSSDTMSVESLIPGEGAYPDQTLFSFACYCKHNGTHIPFTSFSNRERSLVDGNFTEGAVIYGQ